jgi:AhpC/TSA family/Thiol:disulfide interchange protein DsbD, N-terminal
VAALSYDPVPVLKSFADRRRIPYPLLSDPGSHVIEAFGLLNPEYPEGSPAHGVPYPGTLVIDAHGIVRERYFEASYRERRTAASILLEEGAAEGGTEVRTPHFVLRTVVSNPEAAPGQRLTLALDFQMAAGVHAYAPGVAGGYRALGLRFEPNALLRVDAPRFPEARPYTFEPLHETVPVFEGRFRVLQDVTLATGPEMDALVQSADPTLRIEATLAYQVCSETVCYPPATLPLSFSVRLRPLDRERPPESLRKSR